MLLVTRPLTSKDGETAAEIFFDAVHNGTADVYSVAQRQAWGGKVPNPTGWRQKFENIAGFAASIDGAMVGFMTIDAEGYIDLAFVRSDLAGQGIGHSLYRVIEAKAIADGIEQLSAQASKKAKPFFLRMGWRVNQNQVVVKAGTSIENFKMSKVLIRTSRTTSGL